MINWICSHMRQTSLKTSEDTNGKIRTIISKEYCGKTLVPNPRPGVPVRLYGSSQIFSPGPLKSSECSSHLLQTIRYFTDVCIWIIEHGFSYLSISIFRNIGKGTVGKGPRYNAHLKAWTSQRLAGWVLESYGNYWGSPLNDHTRKERPLLTSLKSSTETETKVT